MKKLVYIALLLSAVSPLTGQKLGLKTNVLYNAATTLNLSLETALGSKTSFDISAAYNPWEFSNTKRIKLWMLQPELRYWFCESFNGHFIGLHLHGGEYNFSGITLPNISNSFNYQGDFYGGGLSYGYQWILNSRWGVEAFLGAGFTHVDYDKYPCATCGKIISRGTKNYWGLTKAGISFIYFIF